MNVIEETLGRLSPGAPATCHNLTMIPLSGTSSCEPDYLLLDDVLKQGLATVREVSEGGSVSQLLFENRAPMPVLLLDGEELVGAKQNRVLNLSILVPAATTLTIPVSCVEAGRWRDDSPEFSSLECAMPASGRARKAEQVSASLYMRMAPVSDQEEVWNDVSECLRTLNVRSRTGALADAYEAHGPLIEEFVEALAPAHGQLGAVFLVNGRIAGVEVLDHPDSLTRLLPKIVRSYAIDALVARTAEAAPGGACDASGFVRQVADARFESFDAIGEGEDLRLSSSQLTGAALAARRRLIDLSAFEPGR